MVFPNDMLCRNNEQRLPQMVFEEFAAQHTQRSLFSTTYEVPVTSSKRLGKGEEVSEVFYSKTLIGTLTETIFFP